MRAGVPDAAPGAKMRRDADCRRGSASVRLPIPQLLVDIGPLRRYPEYRRLWFGYAFNQLGSQLSVVILAYAVYKVRNSSLDVGLVSLVQLAPAFAGSILGGSIADAMDRRVMLVVTGLLMTTCTSGIALEVGGGHPSLLALYLLAALNSGLQGANGPAVAATLMSIVPRDNLVVASALQQLVRQASQVLGPAAGGLLIAFFGVKAAFWVNALCFALPLLAVITVGKREPVGGATRFGLHSITEGFQFLRGRQAMQACFIADLNAMVLGMPTALFPAFALHQYLGGAKTVGLLYAAPGIGAFVGSTVSGWTSSIRYPGRAVCIAIAAWGFAIAGFGLSHSLALGVVLLAFAGAADVVSAVFRSTIIQTESTDRLRGRVTSIHQAVVQGGPRLGNTEAGLVAAATNVQFSVVSGGLGCVVGIAIIAHFMPRFLRYTLADANREGGEPGGGDRGAPGPPGALRAPGEVVEVAGEPDSSGETGRRAR